MSEELKNRIIELRSELKDLIESKHQDKVSIIVETSEDESIMLGTCNAYLSFVCELLDGLNEALLNNKKIQLDEMSVPCATIGSTFNQDGDAVVRSLILSEHEYQTKKIINTFNS